MCNMNYNTIALFLIIAKINFFENVRASKIYDYIH